MARVFACIALRLTIAMAVQDGTAVAPNPFDAPTNKRRERKHTHAESAACYGRRYPDLPERPGERRGHPRGFKAPAPLRTILTNLTEHEVRRRALHHSDIIVDVLHS